MKSNKPRIRMQTLALLLTAAFAAFSTGCGKSSSAVTAVTISTTQQNGDQFADLAIQFQTNGIALPSISIPIFNPLQPSISYGIVQLKQVSSAIGEVLVGVDLTVVAKLPGSTPLLPNGDLAPLGGTDQTKVLSIPIPTTHFILYLAFQLNALNPGQSPVVMAGLAMPFPQLDAIGQFLGNSELFIPFNIQGVAGTAGVFGSKTSGNSGFAFFIDFSGLIPQPAPTPTPTKLASAMMALSSPSSLSAAQTIAPATTHLQFLRQSPGFIREARVGRALYQLGSNQTQPTVE